MINPPDGWKVKPLIECTSDGNLSYGVVQPGKHSEKGVPMLRVNNFENGAIDLSSILKIDEAIEEKHARTRLSGGEVLLTLVGSTGQSVIADDDLAGFNVARAIAVVRPSEDIGPTWINICLRSHCTKAFLDSRANTTVQKTLNLADVRQIPILIPPSKLKPFIESSISTLDDKIELNRRMNGTLESMARALFKSWFVDFDPVIDNALAAGNPIPEPLCARAAIRRDLGKERKPLPADIQKRFPDAFKFDDQMGWIPEGWIPKPFGEILESTIGGDWGKDMEDEKHTLPVVIIRGADIPDVRQGQRGKSPDRWVAEKKFKNRELQDGDIMLEVSGGSATRPTGRSLYMTDGIIDRLGGRVVPASFCRKFRPKSRLLGLFASLHLKTIYDAGKMWGYQNQSTGLSN